MAPFSQKDIFGPLCLDRTAKEWTGNGGEREGMTCSKGPQGGTRAAAARTKTLHGAPNELPRHPIWRLLMGHKPVRLVKICDVTGE